MEDEKTGVLSKINWTQIIGLLATVLTLFGLDLSAETQLMIVATVSAGIQFLTVVLRTWFTSSRITSFL